MLFRSPRSLGLLLSLVAASCGAGTPTGRASERSHRAPNVLLVVVDTLRADHLGCYGYGRETSPRIDQLASEGVRYERALSQAPWTTPSVASLMTSLYPTATGIGSEREVLADELVLLPELLAAAGYRTGAVISHTFCSARWNFDQGFDWFDQSNIGGHAVVTSEGVTARALEFIDQVDGAPFLLWAHYFDPHFFYVEHADFAFDGPEASGSGGVSEDYDGPVKPGVQYTELLNLRDELTPADYAELMRIYDSEIAHTDRWIGALLDGLRERGLFDDTLVVLTGDHGEEFGDHGDLGHARTLYSELINVPLIVKYPAEFPAGPEPGAVVREHVALLDIFPTVLEVTDVPLRGVIEGRSLLSKAPGEARAIVSETARRGGVRSLVRDGHKLIRRVQDDAYELYDLERDPLESEDLAATSPEQVAVLKDALEAWERATLARTAAQLELSGEDLEELRKLGYAGADQTPDEPR